MAEQDSSPHLTPTAYPYPPTYNPGSPTAPISKRSWWQRGNPIARPVLVAVAMLLVLAVGIGGFALVQHATAKPDGYLLTSSNEVVFVQLTEDASGHISGTWHEVHVASDETVTSGDYAFTGIANGSQISLTFSLFGISDTLAGTLDGDTFTLQGADSNGYLITGIFRGASVTDYNNAVALLRQHAATYAAATQSAQATATTRSALDQAVVDADNQLSSDLGNLSTDSAHLASSTNFDSDLKAYARDWTQMQTDYQKEQSDYKQGCGDNGYNASVVSYDASVVNYDLTNIQYDDSSLSYDEYAPNTALAQVQSDIQGVQRDWQTLQSAAADTGGTVTAQHSANDVNSATASAQAQISAANKALADVQSKASGYDKEAAKMNSDAQNLSNSLHC